MGRGSREVLYGCLSSSIHSGGAVKKNFLGSSSYEAGVHAIAFKWHLLLILYIGFCKSPIIFLLCGMGTKKEYRITIFLVIRPIITWCEFHLYVVTRSRPVPVMPAITEIPLRLSSIGITGFDPFRATIFRGCACNAMVHSSRASTRDRGRFFNSAVIFLNACTCRGSCR